jgi:ribosomal protein L31E
MNNSVFGKTMENIRQRINFRLITSEDQAWRVKNLNKFTIFSETLVGVHIQKQKIILNKPVYLGQTILDDSKALMYDFHYNFMLKKVPREDIDLLFTDTDSLCYVIRKHDIFEIMKENKDYFDLSDYPKDHELYDPTNKKVIGKFKNESIDQITEFVGLRAKLYAYTVDNSLKKHLKAKGVKRCVAKKDLNIDMYRDVLFNRTTESVKQSGIRSYGHQLYTESVTKTALSGRDDKVYICDDNINTYNFGYYGLEYEYEEYEEEEC